MKKFFAYCGITAIASLCNLSFSSEPNPTPSNVINVSRSREVTPLCTPSGSSRSTPVREDLLDYYSAETNSSVSLTENSAQAYESTQPVSVAPARAAFSSNYFFPDDEIEIEDSFPGRPRAPRTMNYENFIALRTKLFQDADLSK